MGGLLLVTIVAAVLVTVCTGAPVAAQLRGHPRGLYVLFGIEMWERFSYYGLRTLLILYLTRHFLLDDRAAAGLYGGYTTLVYLTPVIGGVLADRVVGARRAVAFGALLLVAGHGLMTVEGRPAEQALVYRGAQYAVQASGGAGALKAPGVVVAGHVRVLHGLDGGDLAIADARSGDPLPARLRAGEYRFEVLRRDNAAMACLYCALALVAMGVGLLKPNVSALVGQLYAQHDPRRDSGFTLYYYGINLGSFWATLLCAVVGETVGWWAGFGLAALGMTLGLVIFLTGQRWLPPSAPKAAAERPRGSMRGWGYAAVLACIPLFWILLQHSPLIGLLLAGGAAAVLGYLAVYARRRCTPAERRNILAALVLVLGAAVFFTLEEQAGSSMNLFAARSVHMPTVHLPGGFGFTMTPGMAQSFPPGFVMIFAPVLAALWAWLERRGRHLGVGIKFALGLGLAGVGFLVLAASAVFHDAGFQVSILFLAFAYMLVSIGELCLSPVGMAEITRLSPPLLVSTLMAVWFLGTASAEYLGGFVAQAAGAETVGGMALNPAHALAGSTHVFGALGWMGVGAGALFLIGALLLGARRASRVAA
ncbi:MAG: oligopeptide:H+ symporter [Caulobacteraceae bacterium]